MLTDAGTTVSSGTNPGSGTSGTNPGTGTGSAGTGTGAGGGQCVPPNIASIMTAKCTVCHGDPPLATALAGLVTYADLTAKAKLDPTKNEAQESAALMALTSGATAMPPGTGDTGADLTALNAWISAGYPPAACSGPTGTGSGTGKSSGSGSGSTGTSASPPGIPCNVWTMLNSLSCMACHGTPLPSASYLASLNTLADLQAPSKLDSTKSEAAESAVLMAVTSGVTAMPPPSGTTAANIAILTGWIGSGYPAGTPCAAGSGPPTPPAGSPFASAAAYAAPTKACSGQHNPGKDCLSCHKSGGSAGSFGWAGTVYANGVAAANIEVAVLDASGKSTSVYSCSNGNVYSKTAFTGPAKVAARNATTELDMITPLQSGAQSPASSGGACNACHCTGGSCTIAQVHLP